ncbi:MAG: cation:proton antiporter, partial [Chloroflexi bacterium]|nr:cation:proton antiporter [Chloroflexota bacterium]
MVFPFDDPFAGAVLTEQLQFMLELGVAVGAALVGGAIAVRLRQPAIVGYLLAGIAIGPATPGFVGDVEQISVLADLGIVLLLFALGVEFSFRELREVARVALPGGAVQVLLTLAFGAAVMVGLGFELRTALVVGACLSISSTLVVLKSLIDRGELDSLHGRAAVGWSIVQDIATIVFIVALPPLAGGDVIGPFLLALVKAAVFLALAYFVGTRVLPWVFRSVSRLGSSELFLLAVVATALLTAFLSSALFGLSVALGAFVAGILVSESDLSYQAAAEVIPFRDLFAVLFFVSVGMLVDPAALLADVPLVALLVAIAVVGKGALTAGLGRTLGLPARSALLLGGSLAQVGEFSFIVAEDGLDLGLLDPRAYNLVLGTAVGSILVSPFALRLA